MANARLYARTDQALARRIEQLATLQQIRLDLVSSLDLDQVMQHLLERAAATAGASLGTVGIWDEEQAVIRVTVTYGYAPEEVAASRAHELAGHLRRRRARDPHRPILLCHRCAR